MLVPVVCESIVARSASKSRKESHFPPEPLPKLLYSANERPYLTHTGRESNAEKQPTGPGPEGCDENGPAAALLVGHVSIQICSAPTASPARTALPTAHFDRNKYMLFRGQDTRTRTLSPALEQPHGSPAIPMRSFPQTIRQPVDRRAPARQFGGRLCEYTRRAFPAAHVR